MDAVVLFTRDLRVHDQPALAAATPAAERVLPLFVLDDELAGSPNRTGFLLESLRDLDRSLRTLGPRLHIRRGVVRGGRAAPACMSGAASGWRSRGGSRGRRARAG